MIKCLSKTNKKDNLYNIHITNCTCLLLYVLYIYMFYVHGHLSSYVLNHLVK